MTKSIAHRVEWLEKEATQPESGVVMIWRHHAETGEQARVRWLAEHPGRDLGRCPVIIVGWANSSKSEIPMTDKPTERFIMKKDVCDG